MDFVTPNFTFKNAILGAMNESPPENILILSYWTQNPKIFITKGGRGHLSKTPPHQCMLYM